jgi:hypothetical protein
VVAYMKRDLLLDGLLETRGADRKTVFAQGELREQEQARFIGDRVVLLLGRRLRGKDCGAGNRRPGRVFHLARNFSGVHLSERGSPVQERGADEEDRNPSVFRRSPRHDAGLGRRQDRGILGTQNSTHVQNDCETSLIVLL